MEKVLASPYGRDIIVGTSEYELWTEVFGPDEAQNLTNCLRGLDDGDSTEPRTVKAWVDIVDGLPTHAIGIESSDRDPASSTDLWVRDLRPNLSADQATARWTMVTVLNDLRTIRLLSREMVSELSDARIRPAVLYMFEHNRRLVKLLDFNLLCKIYDVDPLAVVQAVGHVVSATE